MSDAEEIKLKSTSGKITLEALGAVEKTVIEATSGDIRAAVKQAGEFKASSASGAVQAVLGSAKKTELKSTSGKVTVEIGAMEGFWIQSAGAANIDIKY